MTKRASPVAEVSRRSGAGARPRAGTKLTLTLRPASAARVSVRTSQTVTVVRCPAFGVAGDRVTRSDCGISAVPLTGRLAAETIGPAMAWTA